MPENGMQHTMLGPTLLMGVIRYSINDHWITDPEGDDARFRGDRVRLLAAADKSYREKKQAETSAHAQHETRTGISCSEAYCVNVPIERLEHNASRLDQHRKEQPPSLRTHALKEAFDQGVQKGAAILGLFVHKMDESN